jgi:hypothetical protein
MDVAVFRPSNGQWWIRKSGDSAVYAFQFGTADDKPVPADFTGDGRTDAAFGDRRPANGLFFAAKTARSTRFRSERLAICPRPAITTATVAPTPPFFALRPEPGMSTKRRREL